MLLTKVTCTYSEIEDRIRMSAMLQEGEPVVFWLTHRLASRMVAALTLHLERSVSRSSLVDMGLLLACQQCEAEWQHEPSEPVSYKPESLRILPEKVALNCSAENAALLFPLGDGRQAQMRMNLLELRQWLAIMHRQYKKAGWPMEVWPEWFTLAESGRN